MKEIPVYLTIGFLDSGKTTFINETLKDKRFCNKESVLIISCEEGEVEYNKEKYACTNTCIESIEKIDILNSMTKSDFANIAKKCALSKLDKVIIEYNGMWPLASLLDILPDNWVIVQISMIIDATTIFSYNANMRDLVVDKIQQADLTLFTRVKSQNDTNDMHKLIRNISRKPTILYEDTSGSVVLDDIEDPLPFDINAPIIEIDDRDFALFYRDICENMENYDGKLVRFKAIISNEYTKDPHTMLVGRNVMTCCANDIAFMPFVANYNNCSRFETGQWLIVEGQINVRRHSLYKGAGPVLVCTSAEISCAPREPIATFY